MPSLRAPRARRRPAETLDDLWGVLTFSPAMVGVDRGGVIRFVNQQAEAMFRPPFPTL